MVNIFLFGFFCFSIIFVFILAVTFITIRNDQGVIFGYDSSWCYSDWKCGDPDETASGSPNITSPVLDFIPLMYSCKAENLSTDTSGKTCICPIQFSRTWDLDPNPAKSNTAKVQKINGSITPSLYVCDNFANANPQYPPGSSSSGAVQGLLGICPVSACQTLWSESYFTTKTVGKPVLGNSSSTWPVKNGTRTPPNGWDPTTVATLNIPAYDSGIIYGQKSPST